MDDHYFGAPAPLAPASRTSLPTARVSTTRTRATSTSFGLVGRSLITVVVLLVPALAIGLGVMTEGSSFLVDPFSAVSLLGVLSFALWVVRDTWKPARRVRR